jgi:hypothetical protein
MRIRAKLAAGVVLAAAALMVSPGVASAHEESDVGPIHMEVGFGTEPAYAGQPNSVQLILSHHDGADPILDLGDSLTVIVSFGENLSDPLPLEPNFEAGGDGIPGDYRAWFVPTQAGPYTFHFTGDVDGTKIDKSFIAGPKTFSVVEEMGSVTFPQVPFPPNNELAARIEQESARTTKELTTVTAAVSSTERAADSAKDSADSAKTVAIAGIIVGAIGLIVAVVALSAARKKA